MRVLPTIRRLLAAAAITAGVLAAPQAQAASTGLLILEGSDAQTEVAWKICTGR